MSLPKREVHEYTCVWKRCRRCVVRVLSVRRAGRWTESGTDDSLLRDNLQDPVPGLEESEKTPKTVVVTIMAIVYHHYHHLRAQKTHTSTQVCDMDGLEPLWYSRRTPSELLTDV